MLSRLRSQSGAILVMTAVAMLALIAFTALVVDYGVMWVARSEAQTAADAAALAGARALAFGGGVARATDAAKKTAMAHKVFGQFVPDASITVNVPIDCPPPHNIPAPVPACIKVAVVRPGLPRFFVPLVSTVIPGARAMAVAMAGTSSTTNCLKPWLIPDKWQEKSVPANTTFNPGVDTYVPPTTGMTGYTLADVGTILTLKEGDSHDVIAPSNFYEIGPAPTYEEAITGCHITVSVGDQIDTRPGKRTGPTKHGTKDLIDEDPNAVWNPTTRTIDNSNAAISPRIVPVAMFSPVEYYNGDKTSGTFPLTLVNMMGFFVQSVANDSTVTGVIVNYPVIAQGTVTPSTTASFLKTTLLVR